MKTRIKPDDLINNAAWRKIVKTLPFFTARRLIRSTMLPIISPPWKTRELLNKVEGHFATCFPNMAPDARRRSVKAFGHYWGCKFAEDAIAINTDGAQAFLQFFNHYVQFQGRENLQQGLDKNTSIVFAGSHVGSASLCEPAALSLFLDLPESKRPPIGIIIEPGVAKYPKVLKTQQQALEDLKLNVRLYLNSSGRKTVVKNSLATLREKGVVTSRIDVLMGGKSKKVYNLFNRLPVYLPAITGTAKLALRTGSTIVPYSSYRTAGTLVVRFEPPIGPVPNLGDHIDEESQELDALCTLLQTQLEDWIRAHPEQWAYWDRLDKRIVKNPRTAT